VEYVLSKAYKSLGFVIRNGKLFDNPQTLLCLYKTYVRSTLEYASIVWSPCYKVHTWSLEKVQRRFAKSFMYFSSGEYPQRGVLHETLLEQVQIPFLASRRKLASISFSQTFLIAQLIAPTCYLSFQLEFPLLVVVSMIPSIWILQELICYNILAYIRWSKITLMWRES
jgi:hypothetical protein